ncbi:hypothetical protein E6P09_19270 (plasmid) [Haloferax mediterranei ATCC 33500]|uniref:Uncharacterized protein n=1 Tax=Haloferax mediterranei (strain ATCC 33500 / DSM 1411 / JCM 8866 / NBRC 14739 / NCIMB 2177 / R-4) TaxID=523841 RepID=I3R964_HALMT|nr:hypothetical protein [Haloferax mediterranei]AFK20774.1 hypothetical protein HFX_4080 [Haloferax mediterranei ATCC 33500]AHZ23978.1 hypothetical protein BM92_19400 [Haloferax mediterranei ATCC 33500]ELZ97552.1 hypothetical protein C439_16588 [Haloferax mediterranei ATCC 33500]MDX5989650.1 hypothetical protein [Haloferax mediterranei ATCC 33500]QCQ77450.1 hypothetical protein E6P09_19270 [Haloferax mediterranei ATCC 33500]
MISVSDPLPVVLFSLFWLYAVYWLTNTLRLYHVLFGVSPTGSPDLVAGNSVAIQGPVTVDEEAPHSDVATNDYESPIAVYVWRILTRGAGGGTVASGVEFESFGIDTNSGEVKVDPGWLREAHDAPMLSNVRTDGYILSAPYRVHPYTSPYVHIVHEGTTMVLARVSDVIEAELDISLDTNRFESKAIPEDALLLVFGELSIDAGTPTIRGTDDTPFFIANCDIHDVRSNLLRRALYYVILFTGALLLVLAALSS